MFTPAPGVFITFGGPQAYGHSDRSCEKNRLSRQGVIAMLTDESVCPTLMCKGLRFCGAGAFACQPIFSQLLSKRFRHSAA
jgi:hypothetical protein